MPKPQLRVQPGGRSTELVRLPSLKTKDALPVEAVEAARAALAHGRTVEIKAVPWRIVWAVMTLLAIGVGIVGMIALSQGDGGVALLVFAISGLMLWAGLRRSGGDATTRLHGRRVAGNGRVSTELWQQALGEVDDRVRAESELPVIHDALIAVADAEDAVNRLVSRNRYGVDQSEAQVARQELSVRIAEARSLMGLPAAAIEATPPHLLNRWAEAADIPETEPVNPDDLK